MKTTLTALIATATVANATIVHLFENEDISVLVRVQDHIEIDDTQGFDQDVHGAKMTIQVTSSTPGTRLNSVYWRANHGPLNGSSDERFTDHTNMLTEGVTDIRAFDLFTDDFNNVISPDPNPFGSHQTNPAFRPFVYADEGRGSYNFTDNRIVQWDLDAENFWFDENVDGGDQFFLYSDRFRNGSGQVGEYMFNELPMSVVYSKEQGSTVQYFSTGNFTEIYDFDDAGTPVEEPSVPEPSAALLTLLAMLGTLRRKR